MYASRGCLIIPKMEKIKLGIKRLITIAVFILITSLTIKIPIIPTPPMLLISGVIFAGMVFLLPSLCYWSELYDKKAFKEKFNNERQ